MAESYPGEIQMWVEDEWYVVKDSETGVTTQGETRSEALRNLAEAIDLYEEPIPDDVEVRQPDVPWL